MPRPPRPELVRRIAARVAAQLRLPEGTAVDPDPDLAELGRGSLQAVVLVIGVEDEFGIAFADEDLAMHRFRTVETITELVEATL